MQKRIVKETKNQEKWRWNDGENSKEFLSIKNEILKILEDLRKEPIKDTREKIEFSNHYIEKFSNGYSEKFIIENGKKKYIKDKSIIDKHTFAKLLKRENIDDLIFEYNQKKDAKGNIYSRRIVIRDTYISNVRFKESSFNNQFKNGWIEGGCNLCCSIEINDLLQHKENPKIKIITSYYNLANDNHNTLDFDRYKNL